MPAGGSRRGPAPATAISTVSTLRTPATGRRSPSRPRRSAGRRRARATATIQATHSAASVPSDRTGPRRQTRPTRPPASPSTVAGPTAGRDRQVGDDRDQADLARDRGDQRRAGELGGRRHRDRLGQPARQPAGQGVAPAGREQQDARGRQRPRARTRARWPGRGSTSSSATTAAPSARAPRCAAVGAHREQRDRAHRGRPHARSARCGRAARSRRCPAPRRRTASGRARRTTGPATSRKPTTRVRLVPETASRWVSPVVRKSSASAGSSPASSPSTSAGTSARWLGRAVADGLADRLSHRVGAAPPGVGSGRAPPDGPRRQDSGQSVTVGRREQADRRAPCCRARRRPSSRPAEHQHGRAELVHAPATGHRRADPAPAPGRRTGPRPRAGRRSPVSTNVATARSRARRPPGCARPAPDGAARRGDRREHHQQAAPRQQPAAPHRWRPTATHECHHDRRIAATNHAGTSWPHEPTDPRRSPSSGIRRSGTSRRSGATLRP